MPSDPAIPDEIQALLAERVRARSEADWSQADALRDELARRGWEVQDAATGSTLRPLLPRVPTATGYADADDLASTLDEPPTVSASVQVVAEDHPDDLARLVAALTEHPPSVPWEIVMVANAPTFEMETLVAGTNATHPNLVRTAARLGWADSRNLGLWRSRGEVTVVLDTSIEPTGDFLPGLLAAFDDDSVGIAGPWGVRSADARQFEEAPPGEVDAVEGYCLAVRREALRAVGGFDRRFRFYRNADLDFSFAVRDAGWRAIRTEPLPLVQHVHRGYVSVPDAERDRLSKRNFYRFLEHWGDRRDLLLNPEDE